MKEISIPRCHPEINILNFIPHKMTGCCEENQWCMECGWGYRNYPCKCEMFEEILEQHMKRFDSVFRKLADL